MKRFAYAVVPALVLTLSLKYLDQKEGYNINSAIEYLQRSMSEYTPDVVFEWESGKEKLATKATHFAIDHDDWVVTNVPAYNIYKVLMDEKEIDPQQLRRYKGDKLAFWAPTGRYLVQIKAQEQSLKYDAIAFGVGILFFSFVLYLFETFRRRERPV